MGAYGLIRELDQHKQPVGAKDLGVAAKATAWHIVPKVTFSLTSDTQHSTNVGSY